MQLVWLCNLPVMAFEKTLKEHTGEKSNKRSKCDLPGNQFDHTFDNTQWTKAKINATNTIMQIVTKWTFKFFWHEKTFAQGLHLSAPSPVWLLIFMLFSVRNGDILGHLVHLHINFFVHYHLHDHLHDQSQLHHLYDHHHHHIFQL